VTRGLGRGVAVSAVVNGGRPKSSPASPWVSELLLGPPGDDLKSDRVASELERQILSGRLRPGERLPTEGELGEMLGVSRSVVRDAVRTLVARGLVTVRQGSGMTVAEPSDQAFTRALLALLGRSDLTMNDVITARATIEIRLVPLAAESGTEEDWEALERSLEEFTQAVERRDWGVARDAHLAFHVGLIKALHQPALELFLKPMAEVILISSAPPRWNVKRDWEVPTHRPILYGLKARDPERTERAMIDHFAATTDPRRYKRFRERLFREVLSDLPWFRS